MTDRTITKLVFVRHGESEKNVLRIKSSTVDKWPLTEKGEQHAENIACKLKGMGPFDIILSSPVLRARQTAEIISKTLGLPVIYEDLLKEYQYGRWNDLTKEELKKNHPDYLEFRMHKPGTEEHFNFKLGGAESRADVVKRMEKFIQKVSIEYPGKHILLVSHGGINGAIAKTINDISLESFAEKELIDHEEIETFNIVNDQPS
ncbi:MAG: histidine phosphatase family protein [Patescibacteria group bacterium]